MATQVASKALVAGYDYFRLQQALSTSFPTFNVDTSVAAVAIGPDSDVDLIQLQYYDPYAVNMFGSLACGVGCPIVTRIDSFPARKYGDGSPAIIVATAQVDVDTVALNGTAYLDVFFYFKIPSAFPTMRKPRRQKTIKLFASGAETVIDRIAFYGRQTWFANLRNLSGTATVAYRVTGLRFQTPTTSNIETPLASGVLPVNGQLNIPITGKFDMIKTYATGTAGESLIFTREVNDLPAIV